MSRKVARVLSVTIWALLFVVGGTAYYVNHYMPHGPSYATGEIICLNDDRGPCGEEYKEDMRALEIPEWAKMVRENFDLAFVLLLLAAAFFTAKAIYGEDS